MYSSGHDLILLAIFGLEAALITRAAARQFNRLNSRFGYDPITALSILFTKKNQGSSFGDVFRKFQVNSISPCFLCQCRYPYPFFAAYQ